MSVQQSSEPLSIDPASLSGLIGMIYDCAIDPGHWLPTLEALRAHLNLHNAMLAIHDPRQRFRIKFELSIGVPQHWLEQLPLHLGEMASLWDGILINSDRPLDEPATAMNWRPEFYRRSVVYREWAAPQGLCDVMGLAMARDANCLASLGMGRHESRGLIGEGELDMMRLIAPHLRRAVTISNLLETATIAAASFESILNALSVGVVLVDRRGQVMHANRSAKDTLAMREALMIDNGALKARGAAVDAALKRSIAYAADGDLAIGATGIGLPAAHPDGGAHIAHVLPLAAGNSRRRWITGSVAAVFIASSDQNGAIPVEALMAVFDLTVAEARVLSAIAGGRSVAETATMLTVAETTVKTHLSRIFSKTGTGRQGELVALVGSLTAPLSFS